MINSYYFIYWYVYCALWRFPASHNRSEDTWPYKWFTTWLQKLQMPRFLLEEHFVLIKNTNYEYLWKKENSDNRSALSPMWQCDENVYAFMNTHTTQHISAPLCTAKRSKPKPLWEHVFSPSHALIMIYLLFSCPVWYEV